MDRRGVFIFLDHFSGRSCWNSCKFYEPTKCTRLALRSNKRQLIHAGPNAFPERLSSKTHPCRYFGITNFTPSPFLPATRLSRSRSTYPSTRLIIDGTFHSGYREKSTTIADDRFQGYWLRDFNTVSWQRLQLFLIFLVPFMFLCTKSRILFMFYKRNEFHLGKWKIRMVFWVNSFLNFWQI